MVLDMKRFTARFVDEARDHLRRIDEGLAALNAGQPDGETVNAILRSAHTIKGSSRMLKFGAVNETAHRLEDVLGGLRDGTLVYSPELGRLLARAADVIGGQIDAIAEGRDPSPPDDALCTALSGALAATPAPAITAPDDAVIPDRPVGEPTTGPKPASVGTAADTRPKLPSSVRVRLDKLDELIKLMGEVVSSQAGLRERLAEVRRISRAAAGIGAVRAVVGHDGGMARLLTELDRFAHEFRDDVFTQQRLMEDLHSKSLVMRMLPLAMIFESASRMVRDLGRSMGKEVECAVSGMDIELDRQLMDRLNDPVLHLLRNAVDHGIEDAAVRQQAGKSAVGHIRLSARQDGGCVVIEVADDGAGLGLDRIRDKAARKGIVAAEQAQTLTNAEAVNLIFLPGFSTSPIVTDVSGRGVGMDVVKRSIVEDLRGTVGVETRPGMGTTFTLRLPLSLAIMRVVLVRAAAETFGFNAHYVARLLTLPASRVLTIAERPVMLLDNEFIPLIRLADLLSLRTERVGADELLVVVVRVGNEKIALSVDQLVDERDMVIKPLPPHLTHLPLVSGMVTTGRSALISVLHAPALLEMARKARHDVSRPPAAEAPKHILVVDDSWNTREIEKEVLESNGYLVTLAEDGLDGLQKARNHVFDAVLTDVEMPNMDGFTLTSSLRQNESYREVPIIIFTSRAKEEDKRRGIQAGADAYVVKGDFNQSNLIDILRDLLG